MHLSRLLRSERVICSRRNLLFLHHFRLPRLQIQPRSRLLAPNIFECDICSHRIDRSFEDLYRIDRKTRRKMQKGKDFSNYPCGDTSVTVAIAKLLLNPICVAVPFNETRARRIRAPGWVRFGFRLLLAPMSVGPTPQNSVGIGPIFMMVYPDESAVHARCIECLSSEWRGEVLRALFCSHVNLLYG